MTITRDLALEQARAAEKEIAGGDYRGPLHGIPYAAKDLLAVKGYLTTWGAKPYANQKFDFNATVIERLNRAGAVLIGKAAMIELAGGMNYRYASASLTGAAKNPWNEGCWTCGSSSGSGAIASAALAAFALGTETWGSILCPSAFCGVSGLRPTFGRVSRYGAMALAAAFRDRIESGRVAELADPLGQINGYVNRTVSAADYMLALQIRGVFQKRADELFEQFDIVAAPTLPVAATPLSTNLETESQFRRSGRRPGESLRLACDRRALRIHIEEAAGGHSVSGSRAQRSSSARGSKHAAVAHELAPATASAFLSRGRSGSGHPAGCRKSPEGLLFFEKRRSVAVSAASQWEYQQRRRPAMSRRAR